MKNQRGFILVELIAVIVLIGIIATFTGFFLYTGISGYLKTKAATEGALNAQMALDRITLELRNISKIEGAPSSTSITYITYKIEELTGTRTLSYAGNQVLLRVVVDPPDYPLLEDVSAFSLSYSYLNLDDDTASTQEVAHIGVEFTLGDLGKTFKTKIFPRNMVQKTW